MSCDTLHPLCPLTTTSVVSAGTRAPTGNDTGSQHALPGGYIIYCLEELASGRHYVGLTRRSLEERVASHLAQARRNRRVRDGGLMAALRLLETLGQSFSQCFSARILARADSADEARALERHWVGLLDCRTPTGFNNMPGGSSVGGLDNTRTVSLIARDGVRTYPSIRSAIADCNAQRAANGQPTLDPGTIYARIAGGWAAEEALGISSRQDPRAVRQPFAFGDAVYTTLQSASAATGLLVDTLRSRLHRAKKSGAAGIPQIGQDRRARAPGRLEPLLIPWPLTNETLTAKEFANRTGVPKATIIHRWHRVRLRLSDGKRPEADAVHTYLTMPAGGKRAAARALDRLLSDVMTPTVRSFSGGARAQVGPGTK